MPDGDLKSDLRLPKEDDEVYNDLKKLWQENNDKSTVFFTVQSACDMEKLVSGRLRNND